MPWRGWGVLRQHPEFFKLWSGQAISSFGSAITTVALPLTAVVLLHASPVQMGLLLALTTLPHLLFGLVAGVLLDRIPRRSILVGADVARTLLLGAIPRPQRHGRAPDGARLRSCPPYRRHDDAVRDCVDDVAALARGP